MPCDSGVTTCATSNATQEYFNANPIMFSWINHQIGVDYSSADLLPAIFPQYQSVAQSIDVSQERNFVLAYRQNELRIKHLNKDVVRKDYGSISHKSADIRGRVATQSKPYLSFVLTLDNQWTKHQAIKPTPKPIQWLNILATVGGLWTTIFFFASLVLSPYTSAHMSRAMFDRFFLAKAGPSIGPGNDPDTGACKNEV